MKRLYSTALLCLALIVLSGTANSAVWEKYCSSPEGAVILGLESDGVSGIGLVTFSKAFAKGVNDVVWSFAGNANLNEDRPCCYVGGGYMYTISDLTLNRTNLQTKETNSVNIPSGVLAEDIRCVAAKDNKCAIWCSRGQQSIRYMYDYSSGNWSESSVLDYDYSEVSVYKNSIIWRNAYGEFGYTHWKSTDLGETWLDNFTNESFDIYVDQLGNQYIYKQGVVSKIDDSGNKIEDYPLTTSDYPKCIEIYKGSKLLVQFSDRIVVFDIATKEPIDTIECDPLKDGRMVQLAIIGDQVYVGTSMNVYKYTDLDSEPVLDNSGINSAMAMFLTPYKGNLLMRSILGLFKLDQLGTVKLSSAFSDMENPSGRDMIVTSDNRIFIIDRMTEKLMVSANDGQDWQEVSIPSGDVADYITEIQPFGLIIGSASGNRVYSVASGTNAATLVASINYPQDLEFQFIQLFGTTLVGITDQLIFRSTDMGANWTGTPLNEFYSVTDMYAMGEDTIWMASEGKFYESTNDGESWTAFTDGYNYLYPLQLPDKSIMFAHATTYDLYILRPDKSITKFQHPAPERYVSSLCLFEGYVYASTIGGDVFRMPYSVLPAAEPAAWEKVAAFPVPASDFVTIALGSASANDASIEVFNSLGEKQTISFAIEGTDARLNVAGLAQGVYSARVANKTNVATTKFVIAR